MAACLTSLIGSWRFLTLLANRHSSTPSSVKPTASYGDLDRDVPSGTMLGISPCLRSSFSVCAAADSAIIGATFLAPLIIDFPAPAIPTSSPISCATLPVCKEAGNHPSTNLLTSSVVGRPVFFSIPCTKACSAPSSPVRENTSLAPWARLIISPAPPTAAVTAPLATCAADTPKLLVNLERGTGVLSELSTRFASGSSELTILFCDIDLVS